MGTNEREPVCRAPNEVPDYQLAVADAITRAAAERRRPQRSRPLSRQRLSRWRGLQLHPMQTSWWADTFLAGGQARTES